MTHRVCPWWLGYFLASPIRRWIEIRDPEAFLKRYIRPGVTVLEPGPGMGFFTIPIARLVGPSGRVIAVDIQPKMLQVLRKRAAKAGVIDHLETRLAGLGSLDVGDLHSAVDFALLYAMVHEVLEPETLFREVAGTLVPGGRLLFAEPAGHVNVPRFEEEVRFAVNAGLHEIDRPEVPRSRAVLFAKPD